MEQPIPNSLQRVKTCLSWGLVVGSWSLFFLVLEAISLYLSELFLDEKDIDIIRYYDNRSYDQNP